MFSNVIGMAGVGSTDTLPARVRDEIARLQDRSERLISLVQLAIVVLFGILFMISPRPSQAELGFDLVPWILALYFAFSLVRLWLSCLIRLPAWFLYLSVAVDMALLMTLIWSFHRTYDQPPAFYLKAPTILYAFIFIALRVLRFDARYVVAAGAGAIAGWAALAGYAVTAAPDEMRITRDYVEYLTSNAVLVGAEFDKIVAIAVVTLVLAAAVVRARRMLMMAVAEGAAKRELSRYFDSDVARRITESEREIGPGQGQRVDAAVLYLDIRGFTRMSHRMSPDALMALLSDYQATVLPAVQQAGGAIDKFLGDGVMATFGAVAPSATCAADALHAIDAALAAVDAWNASRAAAGQPVIEVSAAAVDGPLVFGAVGDGDRLEFTVIGEPVNLAAKLEKMTRRESVRALTTEETYARACAEGYAPSPAHEHRPRRRVEGIGEPVDLVVIAC